MIWDRTAAIGMAKPACVYCGGLGTDGGRPCKCVLRAVFRACWNRFRECAIRGAHVGTVSWEYFAGPETRGYSRKTEEYMADFCLIGRRALDGFHRELFRLYFLGGVDWKLCCDRLGIDRGNFFHSVYRIEEQLGRAFVETEPYGLYPLDEYFGDVPRRLSASRLSANGYKVQPAHAGVSGCV